MICVYTYMIQYATIFTATQCSRTLWIKCLDKVNETHPFSLEREGLRDITETYERELM